MIFRADGRWTAHIGGRHRCRLLHKGAGRAVVEIDCAMLGFHALAYDLVRRSPGATLKWNGQDGREEYSITHRCYLATLKRATPWASSATMSLTPVPGWAVRAASNQDTNPEPRSDPKAGPLRSRAEDAAHHVGRMVEVDLAGSPWARAAGGFIELALVGVFHRIIAGLE